MLKMILPGCTFVGFMMKSTFTIKIAGDFAMIIAS